MVLDEQFIRELTRDVWSTLLGLDVEPAAAAPPAVEGFTTSVDIVGAWEGTIALSFSRALGRRLAAAMLSCPEDEMSPELVLDVVGELANVLGGNVKSSLPGPSVLSLPHVETGTPGDGALALDTRIWFACAGQHFSVAVRPRAAQTGSAS